MSNASSRLRGIETFRTICCFFVVCLHFAPASTNPDSGIHQLIDAIFRGAVPFFFVVSGYFQGRLTTSPSFIDKTATKLRTLMVIWAGWLIVGLTISFIRGESIVLYEQLGIYGLAYHTVIEGGFFHLWFVPALFFTILWTTVSIKFLTPWITFSIAAVLYLVGSLEQTHSVDFSIVPGNSRDFVWFGGLPYMAGFLLFSYPSLITLRNGVWLSIAGIATHCLRLETVAASVNYVETTFLTGSGYFMIAKSWNPPRIADRIIGHTLGIYCLHGFPSLMLTPLLFNEMRSPLILRFIPAVLMYFACFHICRLLSKTRFKLWVG